MERKHIFWLVLFGLATLFMACDSDTKVVFDKPAAALGVQYVYPAKGQEEVPTGAEVNVVFNQDVDEESLNASMYLLKAGEGSAKVAGAIEYSASRQEATFRPEGLFSAGKKYMLVLEKGMKAKSGAVLPAPIYHDFTITKSLGGNHFQALKTFPAHGAETVAPLAKPEIIFNQPFDASLDYTEFFSLTDPWGDEHEISAAVGNIESEDLTRYELTPLEDNTAPFKIQITPKNPFAEGIEYTITISKDLKALSEMTLGVDVSFSFTIRVKKDDGQPETDAGE